MSGGSIKSVSFGTPPAARSLPKWLTALLLLCWNAAHAPEPVAFSQPIRSRQLANSRRLAAEFRTGARANTGRVSVGWHSGGTGAFRRREVHDIRHGERTGTPQQDHLGAVRRPRRPVVDWDALGPRDFRAWSLHSIRANSRPSARLYSGHRAGKKRSIVDRHRGRSIRNRRRPAGVFRLIQRPRGQPHPIVARRCRWHAVGGGSERAAERRGRSLHDDLLRRGV